MSAIRKLAGQTALYGLPSILGRFLNYLLVPIHVAQFDPEVYGIITELYAYLAFFVVILTYGMETAFFKFSLQHEKENVYGNALCSILLTSLGFLSLTLLFAGDIAAVLDYGSHPEYITWFALILVLDAISAIPLARLREENRGVRFASVNLAGIFVNIGVSLFFIAYCMVLYKRGESNWLIEALYNPAIGVGYVFIANLMASGVRCLLLIPEFFKLRLRIDGKLLKSMLLYALPLLFVSLAGTINETFSRGFFKYFMVDKEAAMYQLGVFGAVYKLSILITLFIQAYRYAAEPFFFKQSKEETGKMIYVQMMNYFVFIVFGLFLAVSLFTDLLAFYFIPNEKYWEGLPIVPILLIANAFLGISYNLSIWYKLSGKTIYGAYIAGVGAGVTILLNWLLIPKLGYEGAAWSTLACYSTLMVLSYLWGQKIFPIPYAIGKNLAVIALAMILFYVGNELMFPTVYLEYAVKILFLFIFAIVFIFMEKPAFIFKRT